MNETQISEIKRKKAWVEQVKHCTHDFVLQSKKYKIEKCSKCGLTKLQNEHIGINCSQCGAPMVTPNDVSYSCTICHPYQLPNKVKMLSKMCMDIYISRAEKSFEITKNTWACMECGRVWFLRQDAQWCQHHDYRLYGRKIVKPIWRIKIERE